MKDLMIDLETLAKGSDAVVLSIGACFFDIKTREIGETFYEVLDLGQQTDKGRKIDPSTVNWWMKQSDAARSVFQDKARPTTLVLAEFKHWIYKNSVNDDVYVWGNGSTFDISIIESLLKTFNQEIPWTYFNVMDFRTFRRFCAGNAKPQRIGTHHNALDDAISQAQFVIEMLGNEKDEEEAS